MRLFTRNGYDLQRVSPRLPPRRLETGALAKQFEAEGLIVSQDQCEACRTRPRRAQWQAARRIGGAENAGGLGGSPGNCLSLSGAAGASGSDWGAWGHGDNRSEPMQSSHYRWLKRIR